MTRDQADAECKTRTEAGEACHVYKRGFGQSAWYVRMTKPPGRYRQGKVI